MYVQQCSQSPHTKYSAQEQTEFLYGTATDLSQKVEALDIWKLEDYTRKHEHNIPHLWATAKGNTTMIWTVPNVRRGSGYEVATINLAVILSANKPLADPIRSTSKVGSY
jgi:hypothetical protein